MRADEWVVHRRHRHRRCFLRRFEWLAFIRAIGHRGNSFERVSRAQIPRQLFVYAVGLDTLRPRANSHASAVLCLANNSPDYECSPPAKQPAIYVARLSGEGATGRSVYNGWRVGRRFFGLGGWAMQNVSDTLRILGGVVAVPLLVVGVAVLVAVGHLVLGPVNKAAGQLKAPTRFQLNDFFWLLVQLQLALGFCLRIVEPGEVGPFVVLLGFMTLASVLMWAGAVSFVSKAGVTNGWRRGAFVLVQLPATLALMMGTPIFLAVALVMPIKYCSDLIDTSRAPNPTIVIVGALQLIGIALGLVTSGWLLRRLSLWILAGSRLSSSTSDVVIATVVESPSPPSLRNR